MAKPVLAPPVQRPPRSSATRRGARAVFPREISSPIVRARSAKRRAASNTASSRAIAPAVALPNASVRATPSAPCAAHCRAGRMRPERSVAVGPPRAPAPACRCHPEWTIAARARENRRVGQVLKDFHARRRCAERFGRHARQQDRAPLRDFEAASIAARQNSPATMTAEEPSPNTIGGSPAARKASSTARVRSSGGAPS